MIASRSSLDDTIEAPISARDDGPRRFPCSQAQKRFWFEEQLHPGNPGLNVAVRWRLEGDVPATDIECAWQEILTRHEPLRTRFEISADGDPFQLVEPRVALRVPVVDLRGLPENDANAAADRLAESEARTPFNLSIAPLIRVTLLRLHGDVSIILVTAHHTVCDGWSIGILAAEMGELCAALQAHQPPNLPVLPLTYGEYAAAERDLLASSAFAEELAFSRQLLHGYKQFELVPDRSRPPVQTSNGDIATILLERALTAGFIDLAREHGCTFFMAALAALVAVLHRYSGETDITLGSQVVGRDDVDVEGLVGCFINTIALRSDVSGDPTFVQFLERTRDTVMDTFEVRHLPLERLIEIVNPKRDLSRNALFSVNFIFQRSFIKNERYGSFRLIDLPSRSAGALYDLNFFMVERPEGWRASCEFNTDLFDRATVERLMRHFNNLLYAVVADPTRPISTIDFLSDAERIRLLDEWNRTQADYPSELTVPQLVAFQAHRNGERIALECGSASLTYAELDAASSRLANKLRALGMAPKTRIGVFLNRSPELVVGLLAVLKAGSAYVPLDPTYPPERIAFIQADAQLAAIVTRSVLEPRLGHASAPRVFVDGLLERLDRHSDDEPPPTVAPDDVAYVIYTSGSTGLPKGVQIPHRALVNLLSAMQERPGLSERDVLVAVTTVSFDIAGLELFLPLVTGARLVIAKEDDTVDGSALLTLLRRHAATVMQATPVTWQLLIESGWQGDPRLKMLCGGEALPRNLATRLLERGGDLWNMYGPTETTIWSAVHAVEPDNLPVPIGGPIANTQFYVLDARGQLLPEGVPGELFIGGDGVALGYLDRPELTRERFVQDPFRGGGKLYRTGDIVRYRGPGRLEFLGRSDHQVKLRGFRIELGEIESALLRQTDVAEAVAVVGNDAFNERAVWAYIVPRGTPAQDQEAWIAALRTRLGEFLPGYMVPSPIFVLAELPRTPNGKIDRGALPNPNAARSAAAELEGPRTRTEVLVASLIAELMGRERIGRNQDIFALGFHSLLAVRLVARIGSALSVKLPLRALFDHPTVAALSAHIDGPFGGSPAAGDPAVIASIHPGGQRTPFFYFHSDVLSDGLYCRRLTAVTGPLQPFHCVAPHGTAGLARLTTVEEMARDYLPRIRSVQPQGPYQLGGFCAGGLVAYELGRLLRAQGDEVQSLILINASAPPSRGVLAGDAIIRKIGCDARLHPRLRESVCYHVARFHDALGSGPRATFGFAVRMVRALFARAGLNTGAALLEPQPFEKRRGSPETENYFAQLTAALTYHPQPYDGTLTLIWGTEQTSEPDDPTIDWGRLVRRVDFKPMTGGHVSPLHDRIDELGRVLDEILR